jgi:hypothetical protein
LLYCFDRIIFVIEVHFYPCCFCFWLLLLLLLLVAAAAAAAATNCK